MGNKTGLFFSGNRKTYYSEILPSITDN